MSAQGLQWRPFNGKDAHHCNKDDNANEPSMAALGTQEEVPPLVTLYKIAGTFIFSIVLPL